MKTKNDPYGLKCKINPKIFFRLRGSQKGGVRHLGKIPKKYLFFLEDPPKRSWEYAYCVRVELQSKSHREVSKCRSLLTGAVP